MFLDVFLFFFSLHSLSSEEDFSRVWGARKRDLSSSLPFSFLIPFSLLGWAWLGLDGSRWLVVETTATTYRKMVSPWLGWMDGQD